MSWLMAFREIAVVLYGNKMKVTHQFGGHNVELVNIKYGGAHSYHWPLASSESLFGRRQLYFPLFLQPGSPEEMVLCGFHFRLTGSFPAFI
jgi:hypothetical protein